MFIAWRIARRPVCACVISLAIIDRAYKLPLTMILYRHPKRERMEPISVAGDMKFHINIYTKAKAKAQVLGIAPLNMRSMCQRRFTIVEVVIDRHWL